MTSETLTNLYAKLDVYCDFNANGLNPLNFIETAADIIAQKDISSVPILFRYFKDDPSYYWIFDKIKILMEHYYAPKYEATIIENIEILLKSAPEWGCAYLMDIFKTPQYLHTFTGGDLLKIIKHLVEKWPLHEGFFQELIMLLNTKVANRSKLHHA